MSNNTSVPAFPENNHSGMTLRDYFAAKAVQGMFAADTSESYISAERKASLAYEMADAMMKARKA